MKAPKLYSDIHGWLDYEDLYDFLSRDFLKDGDIFVEVGSWQGRSISYIAQRIKSLNKDIKIFAIDTFKGQDDDDTHQEMVKNLGGSTLEIFNFNLKSLGLQDIVTAIELDSIEASKTFENNSINAIFIDGDHRAEAVAKDLNAWYPKIKKEGVFCGHDYTWDSVKEEVHKFIIPKAKAKEVDFLQMTAGLNYLRNNASESSRGFERGFPLFVSNSSWAVKKM